MAVSSLSRYKVLQKLGGGGMGVVYKAEDTRLKRTVALKFLPEEIGENPSSKERFLREARAAGALDHPNIAVVHDVGESPDGMFIAMAYYPGESIKKKIERGPLPIEEALELGRQIAEGLAAAHNSEIIHRDIKPANVMVTREGQAKIVDFGLAKLAGEVTLTRAGANVGTVVYMSPEQVRGERVDQRTDLWSLGVLLYEMITGKRPFSGKTEVTAINAILSEAPTPLLKGRPDCPELVEDLVLALLSKDREDRPTTAAVVAQRLSDLQFSFDSTKPLSDLKRFRKKETGWSRLKRGRRLLIAWVVGILAAILLAWAAGITFWNGNGDPPVGAAREETHLAVLPLTYVGDDPGAQAFSDGLVETLTSTLTHLEEFQGTLWVVPASEVRHRGVESVEQAREIFGVNFAITGSLQRSAERIRLSLNLVDAGTLRQVSSEVIDHRASDLPRFQDRVGIKVAEMLEIELDPATLTVLTSTRPPESEAYDLHIQARGYLQRYDKPGNLTHAIDLLERALAIDDQYALAEASLGEAYWRLYESSHDQILVDSAKQACARAVELDPDLAPVHVTLGLVETGTGQYDEALASFNRALELDPRSAEAYRGLAAAQNRLGMIGEAESTLERAITLRPMDWGGYSHLGAFYVRHGRYDEAIEQFQKCIELTPDNYLAYSNLGGVYFYLDRRDEARDMFERSLRAEPNYRAYSNLGTLLFAEGEYAEAARSFEKALELDDSDYRVVANLASAHHFAGERDEAMRTWDQASAMVAAMLEVNPNEPVLLASLAVYRASSGRPDEARPLVEKALELAPKEVGVLKLASEAYESLGERDLALEHLITAVSLGYPLAALDENPTFMHLRNDPRLRTLTDH